MGKILKADNRVLTQGQKYSYLNNNYTSGRNTMTVESSLGFAADKYVLLSEFGSENSELMLIGSVNTSTHVITFKNGATTKFSHSESTKLTILPFNQIKFYHCAAVANVGSVANSTLLATENVQADSLFTQYEDVSNSSGFGWLLPYNETTTDTGPISNAIPYAGFGETNVKYIFDTFLSQLNNKEKKLIDNADMFAYLNEGYSKTRRQFNLVTRSDEVKSQSITPTTTETALNSDFFKVVSVYNETDDEYVDPISFHEKELHDDLSGSKEYYYIRREDGVNYFGVSPAPGSSNKTYTVWYNSKTARINSYYDFIYLPDNNVYPLVNFMMYKASKKLGRSDGGDYYSLFQDDIKMMKEESQIKIESGDDSWEPDHSIII